MRRHNDMINKHDKQLMNLIMNWTLNNGTAQGFYVRTEAHQVTTIKIATGTVFNIAYLAPFLLRIFNLIAYKR